MTSTNFGQKLADAGYWVFPLADLRKFPVASTMQGKDWGQLMNLGTEGRITASAALATAGDVTGSAICLQPADPVPIVALDVDNYGAPVDKVWSAMQCDGDMPPVVRTASGGCHFWWRIPEGRSAQELPMDFDLGAGAKGEIRASREARQLLVLPGSVVLNKHNKRGAYTEIGFPDSGSLDTVPAMPAQLWDRLVRGKGNKTTPKLPTEVLHFLELLEARPAGSLKRGSFNTTIAQVGQVAGRISGWESPGDELASSIYNSMCKWLEPGEAFNDAEFQAALHSGFKKGKANGDKYQPRDKWPTVTDVLAECRNLFGAEPWVVEMIGPDGKTQDWVLGLGGSVKSRDDASRTVVMKDVGEAWVSLCQLGSVDIDTASQSPLHIMPGWRKALHLHLMTTKAVDHMGLPPTAKFWNKLAELTRDAAKEQAFLRTRNGERGNYANLFVPASGDPELILLPDAQQNLTMFTADNRVVTRERRRFASTKTLRGMQKGTESWSFPLTVIGREADDSDLVVWVMEQYTNYRSKEKGDGTE